MVHFYPAPTPSPSPRRSRGDAERASTAAGGAVDDALSLDAIDATALEGTATDAAPAPDHDLVEVAAGAADVGVLDLHGELDLAREASRRRRRERRLVHVEPRRDEVEAERRGPAAWRVVDRVRPRRHRRDAASKPAHAAARDVAPDDGVEAY